jgi:hypothetical protein
MESETLKKLTRLAQGVQKPTPVLVIPEKILAMVSPIHHVINRSQILDA